ncbi:hypothetical protein [Sphingobacterium corticibacter]|uniref:Uncharacterized protein n=1 Tax=Sphingobacterium corticibacter TaxID=2171749 RepID=A0A2T8HIF7_9SPHI|nr:hypothetical protein [Sphingobacterium corticibacter]PVH25185.1 hypothetical protein DC487_09675 [Sphingobacterium corticibacter]
MNRNISNISTGFPLTEDLGLNLAVNYPADRSGRIYSENIVPDIIITRGDHFEDLSKDLKVQKAVTWLRDNR